MILTKRQCAEIESHFFNAQAERLDLMQRRADVEHATRPPDETGRRSNLPSDSVGSAVVQLERETSNLAGWVETVTETFEHFRGTPKGSFMAMLYTEKLPRHRICKLLFVSGQTYYDWRRDILIYAAFQAVQRGIMAV